MQNFQDPPIEPWDVPPPRRKRSTLFWFLVLIPVGLVGSILLLVGVGAFFVLTANEEEVTQRDRQLVVDAQALAEHLDGFTPNPQNETITKTKYIDSSYDIEYEYDEPDDIDEPYLYCCVTVESNRSDAATTYALAWQTSKMGWWGTDVEVEIDERNDLFQWGDKSRFAIVKADGELSGNLFVARKGKVVIDLMLTGACFDTADGFSSFVTPALEEIGKVSRVR